MNRKELVKRLKYMIKSVAPNSQTILYGSEARGEAKQNSDIDYSDFSGLKIQFLLWRRMSLLLQYMIWK